eukprot:TRINITY_DN7957_c0_g1_i1.p1 TRINITY_DN7957_c0_g1~~TRINITY_DN7957_c0_g1_i1.p1  ORF type:complete len:185 (+),score=62.81 TRINITY_DN7957_c0_g1_i1:197-751(+)
MGDDTDFDSFFDEPQQDAAAEPQSTEDVMFGGDEPAESTDAFESEPVMDAQPVMEEAPAPVADMSNAFVTTQNLACDSPALAEWRAANSAKLAERAAQSATDLAKMHEEAKNARDLFYEQRKTSTEASAKANREEEASTKEAKDALAQKDNLWESVTDMIDLQAKGDGKDVTRMRSVMISMKNA